MRESTQKCCCYCYRHCYLACTLLIINTHTCLAYQEVLLPSGATSNLLSGRGQSLDGDADGTAHEKGGEYYQKSGRWCVCVHRTTGICVWEQSSAAIVEHRRGPRKTRREVDLPPAAGSPRHMCACNVTVQYSGSACLQCWTVCLQCWTACLKCWTACLQCWTLCLQCCSAIVQDSGSACLHMRTHGFLRYFKTCTHPPTISSY